VDSIGEPFLTSKKNPNDVNANYTLGREGEGEERERVNNTHTQ